MQVDSGMFLDELPLKAGKRTAAFSILFLSLKLKILCINYSTQNYYAIIWNYYAQPKKKNGEKMKI